MYTIWYVWPEFAQKQAQAIWNQLARRGQLVWLPHFQMIPFTMHNVKALREPFDWIYLWIPFLEYADSDRVDWWGQLMASHLTAGGIGCVAGPPVLGEVLARKGFHLIHEERGIDLPTFRLHQTILPYGNLNPDLVVWIVWKS